MKGKCAQVAQELTGGGVLVLVAHVRGHPDVLLEEGRHDLDAIIAKLDNLVGLAGRVEAIHAEVGRETDAAGGGGTVASPVGSVVS